VQPRQLVVRCIAIGAITGAAVGSVGGLVVGLMANPGTAWFAIFELGIPATIVGTLLGLVVGAGLALLQRIGRSLHASKLRGRVQ
jgi:hypothetical protein